MLLEIAAVGFPNVLDRESWRRKSMLAKRPTILPPIMLNGTLETTKIHDFFGPLARSGPRPAN